MCIVFPAWGCTYSKSEHADVEVAVVDKANNVDCRLTRPIGDVGRQMSRKPGKSSALAS